MITNNFKIAWRNLYKNGKYSWLSIFGLSLGLAVFITALVYVNREKSYDRWDDQLDHVYRVITQDQWGEDLELTSFTPAALGTYMHEQLPEVEHSTAFREAGETLITIDDQSFYSSHVIIADSNFFNVFPYPFRAGDPAHALNQPEQAVLTRATAEKWFGTDNPIGKTLEINKKTYTISGVFDKPGPSHLDFHVCISAKFDPSNWNARVFTNYVLVKTHTNLQALEQKAKQGFIYHFALGQQNSPFNKDKPEVKITNEKEAETWLNDVMGIKNIDLFLESVVDIHLQPKTFGWRDAAANHPVLDFSEENQLSVWIFSVIGILVLILAAINYTNIEIAISYTQTKYSGLRKIIGASKSQLSLLSLTNSLIQISMALVGALLFSTLIIQYLNKHFGMELQIWSSLYPPANIRLIIQLAGVALIVALLTGLYPAYIMLRYKPIQLLKGELKAGQQGSRIRNTLVVLQFVLAVMFIASLVIIRTQLSFMKTSDPGFTTEQVLRINGERVNMDFFANLDEQEAIMNSLEALPEIKSIATTHFYPGKASHSLQKASFGPNSDTLSVKANWVGLGYFETLDIAMVQGRAFSVDYATDTIRGAVINETAAKRIGLQQPVGEKITALGMEYQIIGVSQDNHLSGYQRAIEPELYVIGTAPGTVGGRRQLLVKFHDGYAAQQALEKIATIWKRIETHGPMRYYWLDDDFAKLLDKYLKIDRLMTLLTLTAISIAIMGIFGISTFVSRQRVKEIGIRKVLGASVSGIVAMLSKDFVKLVLLAVVIAAPIAWWAMYKWLEDFAYRIDIQWWMFAVAGLAAVVIALLTVSWQAIRAAVANPVDSLRDE